MADWSAALSTTMIGMMGVVVGAIISNYVNQRIAAKNARRELMFRKKVEYFDRTVECIEKNILLYRKSIRQIEKSSKRKNVEKVMKDMKKYRKKFDIMTSPLYLDARRFSAMIQHFVNIEKRIFSLVNRLTYGEDEESLEALRKSLRVLDAFGEKIIGNMRVELRRE